MGAKSRVETLVYRGDAIDSCGAGDEGVLEGRLAFQCGAEVAGGIIVRGVGVDEYARRYFGVFKQGCLLGGLVVVCPVCGGTAAVDDFCVCGAVHD